MLHLGYLARFCLWKSNDQEVLNNNYIQKQPLEVFYKKSALKNFAKFIGKQLYQSRDSGTAVFLWILQHFSEDLIYRTPLLFYSVRSGCLVVICKKVGFKKQGTSQGFCWEVCLGFKSNDSVQHLLPALLYAILFLYHKVRSCTWLLYQNFITNNSKTKWFK